MAFRPCKECTQEYRGCAVGKYGNAFPEDLSAERLHTF